MDNSFRRAVITEVKHGSGKGGGRAFYEKYYIEKGNPNPIILVAGQHPDMERGGMVIPYYKFKKHTRKLPDGKIRSCNCSAGWNPHQPQPCSGCNHHEQQDKSISEGKVTSAFTMVHLGLYHRHPLVGKDGKVVISEKTGEVVMIDDACTHPDCNFCRIAMGQQPVIKTGESFPMYDVKNLSYVFGKRRWLETGSNHLNHLLGWDKSIREWCGICRSKLRPASLHCSLCKTGLLDLSANPLSQQQLDDMLKTQYPCTACGKHTYLDLNVVCDTCQGAGRQSLINGVFDVVVYAEKTGEGTGSTLNRSQHFTIEEFEQTLPPNIRGLFQGKSLRQLIQELGQPYDFDKLLVPLDYAGQEEALGYAEKGQGGKQQQQQNVGFYGQGQQMQGGMPQQPPYGGQQMGMAPPAFAAYPQQGQTNFPQPQQPQYPQQPQPGLPQPSFAQPQPAQQPGQPGPLPYMVPPKPNFGS